MQHFHTAGLVGEVLLKMHGAVILSAAERTRVGCRAADDRPCRANGLGEWVTTIDKALGLIHRFEADLHGTATAEWVGAVRRWLTSWKQREDQASLEAAYLPLASLHSELYGLPASKPPSRLAPVDVLRLFVGIRNKTTAHSAYGAEFWDARVSALTDACEWLIAETPLWDSELVLVVRREGRLIGRILRGFDPEEQTQQAPEETTLFCSRSESEPLRLAPLLFVDPGDNSCYLANGQWRDSDSSAEFLCHAIAAATPGQATRRIQLPQYGLLQPLPQSETHGAEMFSAEKGRVLNTLPMEHRFQYVHRPRLEEELRRYLDDPGKRHVINVRGRGGVGKTSVVLHVCHDLASNSATCPYDTIIWFSARDVDLTPEGPKEVSRATSDLDSVWRRVAELLGDEGEDPRVVFERLVQGDSEAHLLVLDNFETFDDQVQAYAYLDEIVRPPNKVIVTSRHYFRGDFQLPVPGMEFEEARELLLRAARGAGAEPLMTDDVVRRIFERCEGHPYAMKLVASQVTTLGGVAPQIDQVVRDEELLEALFRRSIDDLAGDQDALFTFLLISQFERGLIEPPLRAVADIEGFDLDQAIQSLVLRSLVEVASSDSGFATYDMPQMARTFARDRLLAGHLLQRQVGDAAERLRAVTGLMDGQLIKACNSIAVSLSSGGVEPSEADWYVAAARIPGFIRTTGVPLRCSRRARRGAADRAMGGLVQACGRVRRRCWRHS